MNFSSILAILKPWHERTADLEEQLDALRELFDIAPENRFSAAIYAVVGGYTREVAAQISWDEAALDDWIYAHQSGRRPMQMGFNNEPLRTISTIEELAQFIADDHARAKNG